MTRAPEAFLLASGLAALIAIALWTAQVLVALTGGTP